MIKWGAIDCTIACVSISAWTEGPNMDSLVFGNGAVRQSIPEKQTAGTGEMRKELEK